MRGTGFWGISYQLSVFSGQLSESRIFTDSADGADFGDFCLLSVFGRENGVCVLRSGDANWKVCGTNISGQIVSGTCSYRREVDGERAGGAYYFVSIFESLR